MNYLECSISRIGSQISSIAFVRRKIPFNQLKEQSHNPNRTHKTIPSSVSIHSLKEQIFCNVKIIKCTNCRSRDKTLRDPKYQGCETNSQSSAFIFMKHLNLCYESLRTPNTEQNWITSFIHFLCASSCLHSIRKIIHCTQMDLKQFTITT